MFINRTMFDAEHFICEVKRRPVLWDLSHPEYGNRTPKLAAWEDVASNMYVDWGNLSNYDKFGKVREIQKKWNNIRDHYVRELKYERKVEKGLAPAKRNKYIYSHLLTFLSNKRRSKGSDQSGSDQDDNEENKQSTEHNTSDFVTPMKMEYSSDHVNLDSEPETSSFPGFRTEQYSQNSLTGHLRPTGDQLPAYSLMAPTPLEQDDDKMFLLSLLPYFKKLNEERKLQARIEVAKLLQNILYKPS